MADIHTDLLSSTVMALFPASHKTVFVLDHGPYFALPCHQVEFDVGRRGGPGFIPLASISKSVWTVAVEAVAEYCRIVWDIFPRGERLIRVVVGEGGGGEGWEDQEQNMNSVMEGLATVGRPTGDGRDSSILEGIGRAMELLCEPSPRQLKVVGDTVVNRGRLVVVTTLEGDSQHQQLLRAVEQQLAAVNKQAAVTAGLMPLAECEVVIVHTQPQGGEARLRGEQDMMVKLSATLNTTLYTAVAGPALASKLLYLCLKHYSLASTTVTGIPMKEEQNASSSANYDVELFHLGESHIKLLGDVSDLTLSRREDCEYMTATLKWCTPRGSAGVELHHSSGAYRITPTEVNSRQSSCLTNFLLSGRSVMLEMQKRSSNKTMSHMLTSHGGEIFIHTLSSSRSTLEDPPSISEGPGGRVTDYRIPDLAHLMRTHRLAPWPGPGAGETSKPTARAKQMLDRATKVFPTTLSSTTIFQMPVVAPMISLLQGDTLTDEGVAECQKIIYQLISMETKGETLPGPLAGASTGKKGGRKDEQFRLMFTELEKFALCHSSHSAGHYQVLECLMQVRNKPLPVKREVDSEAGLASRELERYQAMTERERLDFNMSEARGGGAVKEGIKTEHIGAPSAKKPRTMGLGGKNLLEIYMERLEREASKKHVEFAGRRNLGEVAKLYMKMEKENTMKEEVV